MIIKGVRTTWQYLFDKKKNPFGGEAKYECTVIIPKDNTAALDAFKAAIQEAKEKAKESYGTKGIDALEFKLKNGDSETDNPKEYEFLKGCYYFTAKNKKEIEKYKAVKQNGKAVKVNAEKEDYYNGMNSIVVANPFVYNQNGRKGITMYLNGIIQIPGGERLAGGNNIQDIDIEDVFLAEEDDDWAVL